MWLQCSEQDRVQQLIDLANAVRYAQNGTKEQFSQYISRLERMTG